MIKMSQFLLPFDISLTQLVSLPHNKSKGPLTVPVLRKEKPV